MEEQSIQPQTIYYSGLYPEDGTSAGQGRLPTLADVLVDNFKGGLGLPRLQNSDLAVLDEAISLLNPPIAQLRVAEERTFTESEMSIVRGEVPLYDGDYALSQKVILIHRRSSGSEWPPRAPPASIATQPSLPGTLFGQELAPAAGTSVVQKTSTDDAKAAGSKEAAVEAGVVRTGQEPAEGDDNELSDSAKLLEANVQFTPVAAPGVELVGAAAGGGTTETVTAWRELPEIVLIWARERRQGGNLIVCPNASMDRLVQAYMVCEVVEHSEKKTGGYLSDRQGMLMGVELGECLPAEQDALQNLLSNYSFQDATLGFFSLLASEVYFGIIGYDDVNVLTLLAVGVVAGLNQEATWPWVFNLIIRCSRITDPMIRVTQCKRVHNHQGQQSGPGVLTIGLAVFGVYLEIFDDPNSSYTGTGFRIALAAFQGIFIVFIVINMVQAVVPMMVTDDRPLKDMLKPWVRSVVNERSFDSNWYLSVLVAIVWAAVIAATVVSLDYDGSKADITREIFGTVVVVLLASLVTTNPGAVIVAVWGALWLVPTGFAFATRSIFDITDRLIHRLNLYLRRMARESLSHFQASDRAEGLVNLKTVILIFQVLPLIPLFALFIPMPFLYFSIWVIHLSLRALLLVSDLIIAPASTFRLYPLLSDYGSVTWKMAHLDMSVERSSMRTMLKRRISKLMENGKLGDMVRNGVIPPSPYSHLGQGPPRLGCVALVTEESGDRVLKADRDSSRRTVSGAGGV